MMASTGKERDTLPQSTNKESNKGLSQLLSAKNEADENENDQNDDDENAASQPPPDEPQSHYTSLRSVLDTLDDEDKSELVILLMKFQFQEEQFNWQLIRKAGWTFDVQLGAYHAPPPQADEYSNDLPPLILKAQEIHEYLDRFALTKLKSFLQAPDNPLREMSEAEIQRGRALRLRVVLLKFEQTRRRNNSSIKQKSSDKDTEHSNAQSQDNHDNSITRQTRSTLQSTAPRMSTTTAESQALGPKILPASQLPRRTSTTTTTSSTTNTGQAKTVSATTFEPGADMYFKKAKSKPNKKQPAKVKSTAAADPDNETSAPPPFRLLSPAECAKQVTELSLSSSTVTGAKLQAIEDSYASGFMEWKFLLMTNHSLLLHGFGSKQKLLQRFAEEELDKEGDVLTIDGFDNEVTIEGILDVIVAVFLNGKEPASLAGGKRKLAPGCKTGGSTGSHGSMIPTTFLDTHPLVCRATNISKALAAKVAMTLKPAIVVLHSVDGMALRNQPAQQALAALVWHSILPNTTTAMHGLWFVASADHVDAATFLWDTVSSASFGWIWREVNTYQPHVNEIAMLDEGAGNKKKSRKRAGASIDPAIAESFAFTVLDSLAPRHVEVVQILAGLQLHTQQQSQPWVSISALREQCVIKCAVRSDEQLRAYLQELQDHFIVEAQTKTSKVRIPYSKDKLLEILEYRKDKK